MGNQGVHEVDVARWFLGEKMVSYKALSIGGRLGCVDDAETPNTLITFHDYKRAPLIMEVRGLPEKTDSTQMDKYEGAEIGVVIECEGGHVLVPNYTSAKAFDKDGKEIKSFQGATNHFENFIQAVRSRRESDLHATIDEGHLSTALCHISNISYRLGRWQSPGEMREQIKGDKESLATFNRMAEHLAANGVDLEKTQGNTRRGFENEPGQCEVHPEQKRQPSVEARCPSGLCAQGCVAIRASNSLLIRVNEIDKGLNIVALGETRFLLAHFQTGFAGFVVTPAIENKIAEGGFIGLRLPDIFGDPIGHLAVGHGIFDDLEESFGGKARGLEPGGVEALGEILLIIGMKFAGLMQPDFIHEPGQIDPARHHFARTARINNFFHGRIIPQDESPVNCANGGQSVFRNLANCNAFEFLKSNVPGKNREIFRFFPVEQS